MTNVVTNASELRPVRRLTDGGWLLPSAVPGLASFTPKFETVMARLQTTLTCADPQGSAGPCWYPPVVPLADIERAEYTQAFPHLLGTVHALAPEASAAGPPQDAARVPADVVLAPAVCYSVYPQVSDRVLDRPCYFDAVGCCYRHEATSELGRLRSFRMREFVVVADEDAAWQWRDSWIARCEGLFTRMGLRFSVQPASDPFFGPGARFIELQPDRAAPEVRVRRQRARDGPGHRHRLGELPQGPSRSAVRHRRGIRRPGPQFLHGLRDRADRAGPDQRPRRPPRQLARTGLGRPAPAPNVIPRAPGLPGRVPAPRRLTGTITRSTLPDAERLPQEPENSPPPGNLPIGSVEYQRRLAASRSRLPEDPTVPATHVTTILVGDQEAT